MSDSGASNSMPIYQYTVKFRIVNGEPSFELMQNGVKVSNTIQIDEPMAALVFNLDAAFFDGATGSFGTNVQWLSDDTCMPIERPNNFAYTRENDTTFVVFDVNTTDGPNDSIFHFLYSVVKSTTTDAVMYASPDPVIINKKPPA